VPDAASHRIGVLGWNQRTLLALDACLVHPPELLVFDTAGNDQLATEQVFDRLGSRPANLAVIYLKMHPEWPCFPGASCLTLVPESARAVVVE
jgi:hypothetical protein